MTEIIPLSKVHAMDADRAIQSALHDIEIHWVQLAIMFSNFKKHEFYRALGFPHFEAWREARVAESRASVYKNIRIVEGLPEIPVRVLQTIPITNCERLLKAAPSKREGLIEKARTMSIIDFAKEVRGSKGNAMEGEEDKHPVTFSFTTRGKGTVDEAIQHVWDETGVCSKGEALEMICADFNSGR